MELREIAEGVYACLQQDRGLGYSNSGLINRGGGLVVDTFWDLPHTRELIQRYSEVWSEPASCVVNTHHNGDHCWGNQLFPQAEIIGHRLCKEWMEKDSPEALRALRSVPSDAEPAIVFFAERLADWDFSDLELRPPTTLIEDRLALDLDGVQVELVHVGPAHTESDVLVHLPEQRIVFTGDVLFRRCTPIGWEGTYEHWIAALDFIARLDPQIVVPGHGPICGTEGPREMRAYLEYVQSESKRFFEAGLTALEAAKKIDLGPYADWTEPERLVFNIERAYRELRGEPHDAPIDVMGVFRGMHELALARGWRRG
jgi:glyoxylase-like metal-dependent hydrolase (beta-lactamase superfamily II)